MSAAPSDIDALPNPDTLSGALLHACAVYSALDLFKAHAAAGRSAEAGRFLNTAVEMASGGLLELERVIVSKLKAAEAFDLTESTVSRVLGKAAEHPNTPANDHDAPPPEPAPFVA